MKKITLSLILLMVLSIFAEKKLVIYRDNVVTYSAVISQIDSMIFEDFEGNAGTVYIDATNKSFQMGGISNVNADPEHKVTFTYSWYMDTTEVTQGDYDAIMSHSTFGYPAYTTPSWIVIGPKYPATATWYDAVLYCNAKSKSMGKDTVYSYTSITGTPGNGASFLKNLNIDYTKNGFRLPTEAEWEYSCRAGTTGDYYGNVDDIGWHSGNSGNALHEVANKQPNNYGLYDMSGNVAEWCNDWYDTYSAGDQTDPIGPSNVDYKKVVRGGHYNMNAMYLRSDARYGDTGGTSGFRTVCK